MQLKFVLCDLSYDMPIQTIIFQLELDCLHKFQIVERVSCLEVDEKFGFCLKPFFRQIFAVLIIEGSEPQIL